MSKNLKTMLCDSHDSDAISSKRVITVLAFIFCTIAFFANLFFDKTIDSFIYETMAWIVLGGFGSTAVEKFTSRKSDTE
jgi:hypothetical protein